MSKEVQSEEEWCIDGATIFYFIHMWGERYKRSKNAVEFL